MFDGENGAFRGSAFAPGAGGLQNATGIAFGPDGALYVSNPCASRVLRFNATSGVFEAVVAVLPERGVPMGLAFRERRLIIGYFALGRLDFVDIHPKAGASARSTAMEGKDVTDHAPAGFLCCEPLFRRNGDNMKLPPTFGIPVAALLIGAACHEQGPIEPAATGGGISFQAGAVAYSASGSPAGDGHGGVLSTEFAAAQADSLSGFGVVGFDATGNGTGDMFVLQAPRATTTFMCSRFGTPEGPCHGRLIRGLRVGSEPAQYDAFYTITDGSLTVTSLGPDRLEATFSATLVDPALNDTIRIENGAIDVPYVSDPEAQAALKCLASVLGNSC